MIVMISINMTMRVMVIIKFIFMALYQVVPCHSFHPELVVQEPSELHHVWALTIWQLFEF